MLIFEFENENETSRSIILLASKTVFKIDEHLFKFEYSIKQYVLLQLKWTQLFLLGVGAD